MPGSPVRRHHRPRTAYWIAQLGGWGTYVGFGALWGQLSGQPTGSTPQLMMVFGIGLTVSHVLRMVIVRLGWLNMHAGAVLPRIALASLLLGIVAFPVELALHGILQPGAEALWLRPPVELLGHVLNWTVLLFIWALAYFAYAWFVRHRREEIRILRLETADRENQLNNLRAQMNPHFMFNALNGIRALIEEDPGQAKRAITQLSAILRNAMAPVKRSTVPLGEEIDIVKAYLELEAMRYEERLRTNFELEPGLERVPVPPMLLQTLVENAVRHGIARLPGGGDLVIGGRRTDEGLLLTVRNSGSYKPGTSTGTGIGLRNTRQRLRILYGEKARIDIAERDGMVVTEVVVPIVESRAMAES